VIYTKAHLAYHPEIHRLGVEAYGFYLAALGYCSRKGFRDLVVPPTGEVLPGLSVSKANELFGKLESGGLAKAVRHGWKLRLINGWVRVSFARARVPRALRREILARDKVCRYCGSSERLQVDHIYPVSRGGGSGPGNLQALCAPCNQEKRDRVPE